MSIQSNKVESVKVVRAPAAEPGMLVLPEFIYLHPFVSSIRYYTDYTFRGWKVIGSEDVGVPYKVKTVTDDPIALRFIEKVNDDPDFLEKVLDGDPYFFEKVLDGDPYFFKKVLDEDPYFFEKVLDGDPYFFEKITGTQSTHSSLRCPKLPRC